MVVMKLKDRNDLGIPRQILRWEVKYVMHEAWTGQMNNAYKILIGKPEEKPSRDTQAQNM